MNAPVFVLLLALGAYLALGLLFGGAYLLTIAPQRDAALRASKRSVRLILLPGCVAVWPLLAFGSGRLSVHRDAGTTGKPAGDAR